MDFTMLLFGGFGAIVMMAYVLWAFQRPAAALSWCFLLVLVAGTKFRTRDAGAALAGSVDSQILFEVGLYGIIAITIVLALLSSRVERQPLSWPEWALAAYAGLALLSILWSPVMKITIVRSVQLAILVALTLVSLRILGPRRTFSASWPSLLFYAILATIGSLAMGNASELRFAWFSIHPITTATLAGAAILIVVTGQVHNIETVKQRLFGLRPVLYAVPLSVVLVATRSRGAIGATALALLVSVLIRYVRPIVVVVLVAFIGMPAVALLYLNLGVNVYAFVSDATVSQSAVIDFLVRGNTIEYLSTLGGRTDLWEAVRELVMERPLVGYGYSASRGVLIEVVPWAAYTHNAIAQSLLDFGFLGTTIFWSALLWALGVSFMDVARRRTAASPVVFVVLFYLVANSMISESFAGAPNFEGVLVFVLTGTLALARARDDT